MNGWREECLRRFKQTQKYNNYDKEDLVEELIEKEQELQRKDNIINDLKGSIADYQEAVGDYQDELKRKDNIINEIKKFVENELPYLYEIDKEYENIEGNTYFTYKEYDYKKILDKIMELESK